MQHPVSVRSPASLTESRCRAPSRDARSPSDPTIDRRRPMHRYTPRWSETSHEEEIPRRDDRVFRDALDFIDYAADDRLTTWYTYPWLWHLDKAGRAQCFSKGSS